ncbi:MAG: aldehyde dehydrogenase family protein, partial [Hyphomicrobiales bacterium]
MTIVSPFIEPRKQDHRLIRRDFRMLIGGKSVDAASGERIERESPAYEGIVVSSVPKGSHEDSVAGIMAARKAFDEGPWPRMSGNERAKILHRIGEAIYDNREELATIEALEIGKPISAA